MNNELTIKDTDLMTALTQTGLSDLIKPLVNEIHLFDTYVAGTTYLKDKSVLDEIQIDDRLFGYYHFLFAPIAGQIVLSVVRKQK